MKQRILLVAGIILALVIGLGVYFSQQSKPVTITPYTPSTPTTVDTPNTDTSIKTYTMTELGQHSTAESCWTAVHNEVFDLTSWVSRHDGGSEAILSLCGLDGSRAFDAQHGTQRKPNNVLTSYKIGVLAN